MEAAPAAPQFPNRLTQRTRQIIIAGALKGRRRPSYRARLLASTAMDRMPIRVVTARADDGRIFSRFEQG